MSDETLIDADAAEAMRAAGRRRVELKQAVSAVEIAAARAAAPRDPRPSFFRASNRPASPSALTFPPERLA